MARRSGNPTPTQAHQEVRQRIKALEAELARARQETKRGKPANNNHSAHTTSPGSRRRSRGVRSGAHRTGHAGGHRKAQPVVVHHRVPLPGRTRVHVERILRGSALSSLAGATAEDNESESDSDDSLGLDPELRSRVQSRFPALSSDPSPTHHPTSAGASDGLAEEHKRKPAILRGAAAGPHRGDAAAARAQPLARELPEQQPKRRPSQLSEVLVEAASPSQRIQASARPDIDELYTRLALLTTSSPPSSSAAHAVQSSPSPSPVSSRRRDGGVERGSKVATSSPLGARRSPHQRNGSHNRTSGTRLPGLEIPPVIISPQRARAAQRSASSFTLAAALKLAPVQKALHYMAQRWRQAWLSFFMKQWREACTSIIAEELFLNGQAKILQRVIRERLAGPALAAARAEQAAREDAAAMRLGAAARGFLARQRLLLRHSRAVVAQRAVRGHLSRRRVRQMLRMALISRLRAIAPRGKLSLLPNILKNEARFSKAMRSKLEQVYRIATSSAVASGGTSHPKETTGAKRNLSAPSRLRRLRRLHRVCIDAGIKNQEFLEREAVGYTASVSARRAAHEKAALEAELKKLAVYRKQNAAEIRAEKRAAKREALRREALKAERLLEEQKLEEEHSAKRLQELQQLAAQRKHEEAFLRALDRVFDWGSGAEDGNSANDPLLGYSFSDQPTFFSSGFILRNEVTAPPMSSVPQADRQDFKIGAVTLPSEAFTVLKRRPNAVLRVLAFISSADDVSVQSLRNRLREASVAAATVSLESSSTAREHTPPGTRAITGPPPQPVHLDGRRLVVWLLVGTMEGKVCFRCSWPCPADVSTTTLRQTDSSSSTTIALRQHVTDVLQGVFSPMTLVFVRKMPENTEDMDELVRFDESGPSQYAGEPRRGEGQPIQSGDEPSDENGDGSRTGKSDKTSTQKVSNSSDSDSPAAEVGPAEEEEGGAAAKDASVVTASESIPAPVRAEGSADAAGSTDTAELQDTNVPVRVESSRDTVPVVGSAGTNESEDAAGPSIKDDHGGGEPNHGSGARESTRHQELQESEELLPDRQDRESIQDDKEHEDSLDEDEEDTEEEDDELTHDEDLPIEDDHELHQDEDEFTEDEDEFTEDEDEFTEDDVSEDSYQHHPPSTANVASEAGNSHRKQHEDDDNVALTEMALNAREIGSDDEFDVDSENDDSDFDEDEV